MGRFEVHSHSEYSNLRLVDCINKIPKLIDYAVELGLSGIALTDHECLSGHPQANFYEKEIQKKHPAFKVALGNEIYLVKDREKGQIYYHFILIAKNKMGYRALRELSSISWMQSYFDRGMERVPTTYTDLENIITKYPDSLIATTACIGGQLSQETLNLIKAEKFQDGIGIQEAHNNIINFILWCKKLFKDDFYIECAPGQSAEQIAVNQRLISIAATFDCKMVLGTDAHYLKKEDRYVHKAYLNSKDGEREVDTFYEYSYLQTEEEIKENIAPSGLDYDLLVANSEEIYNKIETYDISHKQTIPKVKVKNYPIPFSHQGDYFESHYPTLTKMFYSNDIYERYWVNECIKKLNEIDKNNPTYLARLEEEADIKKTISEKLETNMFCYPIVLQHYVDLFWKCGSTVGAGRGSSCSGLNHYLLGITQLDPIEYGFPFWRYLNKERIELGDIDLDLCPSKRPMIIKKIKEERGENFSNQIDKLSRRNLGCTLISTFGREGTKSAILTACRGYRGEGSGYTTQVKGGGLTPESEVGKIIYYDGIDVDTAQYLSSLIPQERGFLWPLKDVVYGNKDKDRKPINAFIIEVNKYPGLLDIAMAIEGLVNKRSSHASGVILFDEDPYEFGCFMKTPKGEIITQYDLHMCEAVGMTKYDLLVTEVQDKIVECIKLLQEANEIDANLSLREVYNKYLHPNIIPLNEKSCWDALQKNEVLNVFQFDSDVGAQAAKKIKPTNITELSDANGLMRLMTAEKGAETPMEKYIRFKNNIELWYKEMDRAGLTKEEQKVLEPYFKISYGVPPSQEQLMSMLMDKNICHFTLGEANAARKIVGKKLMNKIPELRQKIFDQAASPALGRYIWSNGVGTQMGYSFSIIHATAYSFIGYQTLYLACHWNPIYWNTACLIVNSASLESEESKDKTTDYSKMAKAIGDIRSRNINVSLIDINNSSYGFKPDVKNNRILFGLKGVNRIGSQVIDQIIKNRPYNSIKDFMIRCPLNKTIMISLIKAGAFDELDEGWAGRINKKEPRKAIMGYYLSQIYGEKTRLTLQNLNGLIQKDMLPEDLYLQKRIFYFNKYLKTYQCKSNYYVLDERALSFFEEYLPMDDVNVVDGEVLIYQKDWNKIYQNEMDKVRTWLRENQQKILIKFNQSLFDEVWNKYALGTISSWEMESLCFYYHDHELKNVNMNKYGIVDFNKLSPQSEVDYFFKRNGRKIPIYKTFKIIGTVIGKNDARSSVSVLTLNGVVNVKFTKEYFAMYNRQISQVQPDGTKKVIEKGWFTRGTKIMVTGFRRDDFFQSKTYTKTATHQLYKIIDIKENGDMILTHDRADGAAD